MYIKCIRKCWRQHEQSIYKYIYIHYTNIYNINKYIYTIESVYFISVTLYIDNEACLYTPTLLKIKVLYEGALVYSRVLYSYISTVM